MLRPHPRLCISGLKRRRPCPGYGTSIDDVQPSISFPSSIRSDFEPKPQHAALVKINRRLAVLHRVRRLGEEHAVVARGLFVFADTAGLWFGLCLLGRRWGGGLRCRSCEKTVLVKLSTFC